MLTVAVLVVAWTLASGALRVTSETIPDAIQLGQVPAAAVPADRAGLHLVGSRKVDLLTRSGPAGDLAPSAAGGRESSTTRGAPATTVPGSSSGTMSPVGGVGQPTTTTPTLPGITLPGLSIPPSTTLPVGSIPSVTLPPPTVPSTTLPGITVPSLSVPTTVTIPKLPLLDLIG